MIGDLIWPVVTIPDTQIHHTITHTITNFRNTFNTNKHWQKSASFCQTQFVLYKSYISGFLPLCFRQDCDCQFSKAKIVAEKVSQPLLVSKVLKEKSQFLFTASHVLFIFACTCVVIIVVCFGLQQNVLENQQLVSELWTKVEISVVAHKILSC